ncbi:protein Lines homolog 1 isoform X2 [Monodelphis domestica]|uniref:protein Lines homolog 1 isoform X2 n=1 Tax=Monodelphis domestica TaxID=13616 RepID=UPI0007B411B6|nr:protein Lines homolog 1 isoform X2 [Monodelphis domestica]XP_056663413.1 protein Lines homolog 1 isoform X2 [Monodelphis domestica]
MEASYQVLEQLYKEVLLEATLENDSQEYAFHLNLSFSAQDLSTSNFLKWPSVHHGDQANSVNVDTFPTPTASINLKMNFQVNNPRDIMLLQLTVIKMMITKILSTKMEFSIKEKYSDIIEILLKPYELESKLISTFHGSDKLLSHMAAKCLASILYLQLREKAIINKTWTAFCLKTLSDYPESNAISYCLWTLTAVIKEILKATCLQKTVELQKFMSELLAVLKHHLPSSLKLNHHCEWLSKIFIEQDDDMLEAAKASLGIYQKLTRAWNEAAKGTTQEKETWDHQTHENGLNPHCIFLFLLKNIDFDATVLLDFLISSETCFLEYFVRYLKLLQVERNHFLKVCKFFDVAELRDDMHISSTFTSYIEKRHSNEAPHQPHFCGTNYALLPLTSDPTSSGTNIEQRDNQTMKSKQPNLLICTDNTSSLGAFQRLVDYDSSEESEEESVEEECLSSIKQTPLNHQANMKIRETVNMTEEKNQNILDFNARLLDPKKSSTLSSLGCEATLNNTASQTVISSKTLKCLKELEEAISRLQRRHLFPYNPSALLKLLKHTEMINKTVNLL